MGQSHIKHQGWRALGKGGPVEVVGHLAPCHMAGDEGDGGIGVPVGGGNPGIGEAADAGGNAGHEAERNPGPGQGQGLFTAAAENARVPALEPEHTAARARKRDQALGNVFLGRRRPSPALAGENHLRVGVGEVQNPFIHQGIEDDHVGPGEPMGTV